MRSKLRLDMHNLSLGRRHLVNAYEVKAGIGVIAGNVWSMPERLKCEVGLLQKARYINTLTFYLFRRWRGSSLLQQATSGAEDTPTGGRGRRNAEDPAKNCIQLWQECPVMGFFTHIKIRHSNSCDSIPILVHNPNLFPFPWESHSHGDSHSYAQL